MSHLLIAKLLPMAFPPIVSEDIIAVNSKPVNNIFVLYLVIKMAAIVVPAAPDITPQTSPITSQQKLDTLSAFFLNFTAILAPFTLLEFIEWNTFSSAVVTATPIISNNTPIKIKISVIIIPKISDKFGIVEFAINDRQNEMTNEVITIVIIHLTFTFSFFIFHFTTPYKNYNTKKE